MNLLDTNVLSELMKARPESKVVAWLDANPADDLFTSAVSRAEIELGLARLPAGRRRDALAAAAGAMFAEDFGGAILAFDDRAAIHYGRLVAVRLAARLPSRMRKSRPLRCATA